MDGESTLNDSVRVDSLSPQHRYGSRSTAILGLVGVNALWGLSFPLMKVLHLQIDEHFGVTPVSASAMLRVTTASWLIGLRFTFAMAILTLFLWPLVRRASRKEWEAGAWIAIFFFVGLVFQVVGLATVSASRSGFLTSLTAVFTPIVSSFLFQRTPPLRVWFGVALALFGVAVLTEMVILSSQGVWLSSDLWNAWKQGDTFTTIAALFFTGQVMLIDHFSRKGLHSTSFTPGMFVVLSLLALVFTTVLLPLVPEMPSGGWTSLLMRPQFLGLLMFLGMFCSLLSFLGMNSFQPSVTAVQASIIYSLEPVFASSWALVLPGWVAALTGLACENERCTSALWMGGAILLVANIVALWPSREVRSPEGPLPQKS